MIDSEIHKYNKSQTGNIHALCTILLNTLSESVPGASAKLYHGHPVWFLDDNPIVGYDVGKDRVNLLFWSGQSFKTPGLEPKGKFKAAGTSYNTVSDLDVLILEQWLTESIAIQWDYKNLVRNKGELVRLI